MNETLYYLPIIERVIPYAQELDGTCGPASLVTIYRSWGERIDEQTLIGEIQPDLGMIDSKYFGGTTHQQMEDNARLHGYNVLTTYNVPYIDLIFLTKQKGWPVIVEWMSDVDGEVESDCHYSVIVDADEDKVRMADPSYGEWKTLDKDTFKKKWYGFERDGSQSEHFAMIIWKKGV